MAKIGAVIVAAGMSTRMKDFKQLMKIGDLSMAERVALNFQRAGIKDIVMVTGYQAKRLEKELNRLGITFLRNERYETTQMFDSAKLGLEYMKDRCEQILFCPVDVPFFTDGTVELLIKQEGKIVFPICRNEPGHPIRIDTSLIPAILRYQGNEGLKGALESLHQEPVRLYVEDEGAITDADTKEDYQYLVELHNARLMRPQVKITLAGKRSFFDSGTVTLLKHIENMGSVKEACERTGISYSKGWSIIHLAESELGFGIVERQPGGKDGGKAFLTEKGKQLLKAFHVYEEKLEKESVKLYEEIFLDTDLL